MDRDKKAIAALFDYGTRSGATASKVRKQMQSDGFTDAEILAAVEYMRDKNH